MSDKLKEQLDHLTVGIKQHAPPIAGRLPLDQVVVEHNVIHTSRCHLDQDQIYPIHVPSGFKITILILHGQAHMESDSSYEVVSAGDTLHIEGEEGRTMTAITSVDFLEVNISIPTAVLGRV
ncbi:hypothetical protein D3C73_893810 [compost metagenome]